MQRRLSQKIHNYMQEHLRHKRWRCVVTALACVVVFCTTYALILPAITMTGNTYCGYDEHSHGEECLELVLTCGQEETEASESTPAHTHTDVCYETRSILVCWEEERSAHTHSAECYTKDSGLRCGMEEGEDHTHDESCYTETETLACGLAESDGHTHNESCRQEERVLTCGQEETETTEPIPGHTHTDGCYEKTPVCRLEEHEHSLICYSNPEADVESAAVWERSIPQNLGDNWAENVVAVANSQLGYRESTANYTVLEDGVTMKGYTRYGAWYGVPYGDWCAMFASFCLHYAGVPQSAVSYGSGCIYWVEQLQSAGLFESAAECFPEPGFLVFFDTNGDGLADHVGIVTEADGETIRTVEGNIGGAVVQRSYSESNSTILGYCVLPQNPYAQADEAAFDEGIALTALLPDDVVDGGTFQSAEGNEMTWSLTKSLSDEYTLTIDGDGAMPDYTSGTLNDRPWAQYITTPVRLVIGGQVTRIGNYAFQRAKLTSLELGGAVSSIGAWSFSYTTGLTELDIPGTVNTIGNAAFVNSGTFSHITLHEGTETIGGPNGAFSAVAELHIPASVTSIGDSIAAVDRFTVAAENPSFAADENGVLFNKNLTELIFFPKSKHFADYRVPDTVTRVRNNALNNSNIDKLTIPASVEELIGNYALRSSYFKEIYFEDNSRLRTFNYAPFTGCSALTALHLPENTPLELGALALDDKWLNMTSIEIPDGVTTIKENLVKVWSGQQGSMLGLEQLRYNARDAAFGAGADDVCGPEAYFALTIGRDVDTLAEKFSYFVEHATAIAFEKNNQLTIAEGAFANAPTPFTGLSGTVYVDAQGVVYSYDAAAQTAKVVLVPADAASVTIPASLAPEAGVTVNVTAVGANALSLAGSLTSIAFEAPTTITEIGAYGLGNCPTLTEVNGAATVEAARAGFPNAVVGHGAFHNTGLTGSPDSGVDEDNMAGAKALTVSRAGATNMTISVKTVGQTLEWKENEDGTGGYTLLTGDTMTLTASVGNTQGNDDYVYRLYIQKGNADCSLNVAAGQTYTFDGFTVNCYATEDPSTVYLEFSPAVGRTMSVPLTAVYPSPRSSGGWIKSWGEILTTGEAAGKTTLRAPGQQINALWKTKPDEYVLSKTLNNGSPTQIIGSADGTARPSTYLSWRITLNRNTDTTSAYGKDIVKSVDFTDELTLPTGIYWSQEVLDAVRNGDTSASGGNLYAGGIRIANTNQSAAWVGWSASLSEDGNGLVFHWKYNNASRTTELGSHTGVITVYPEALYADLDEFAPEDAGATLTNTAKAAVHHTYSGDENLTASVDRSLTLRQGTLSLTKTASGGSYFGEDITYTVKLQNTGAVPWTGTDEAYYIQDDLSLYSYISPENMERMFAGEYGDHLTITITNATLGAWQSVTAADGSTVSYRTSGNSNIGTGDQTLTITKSEGGYTVSVTGGGTCTGATAAEALQSAGYAVTPPAKYRCTWTLDQGENEKLTISGGQGYTFLIYAAAKDTFGMIATDWENQYPIEQTVTVKNEARLYGVTNTNPAQRGYYAAQTQVKREAHIGKSVYDEENQTLGKAPAASDGAVLNYQLDFTHYGSGAYDNLPMVDDLYGNQYLLVRADRNPGLAGLATKESGGVTYYVLTEGEYTNIVVGEDDEGNMLTAATVTVTRTDTEEETTGGRYTGVHTQIKWYFAHLDGGSYRKTVRYQAVVDISASGSGSGYTLGNIVWMNDRRGDRIYDKIWGSGGGAKLDFDKSIVENRGAAPAQDVLDADDYTAVSPGDQVTYRLALCSIGEGAYTLSGKEIVDMLPETYDVFTWEKGTNVSLEVVTTGTVEASALENWSILPMSETSLGLPGTRLCMVWPEDARVTIPADEAVYLYVTLTFPTDTEGGTDTWTRYAAANSGTRLDNTLLVHRVPDSVEHELKETGAVLLQKGVLGIARTNNSTSYYATGIDRQHYANKDRFERSVFYYVTLYNGGNKRLYLNELHDNLPKGFHYASMLPAGFDISLEKEEWVISANSTVTAGGQTSKLVNIQDLAAGGQIVFRSATVTPTVSGAQHITFTVSAGTGSEALKYDSVRQQYYLDRGEALVFGYAVKVDVAANTEDAATNTIAMPYTDHLSTGVSQIDSGAVSVGAVTTSRFADSNDGDRRLMASGAVQQQYGFNGGTDGQWLVSVVTQQRGGIVPGITKYTDSYINDGGVTAPYKNSVEPNDTVNWRLRVQNTGTISITDYTITDVMPSPYVFTGKVGYTIYDSKDRQLSSGTILSFQGTRTGSEDSLPITNDWGGSGTLTLTINGPETWLATNSASVSMSRNESGNEVLTLRIQALSHSIPEGGYMDVTFSSLNPTTDFQNSVYVNQATFTPNQQSFTIAGQGSIVRDDSGKAVSVRNSSPVTVSFGFTTSSEKRVTETANGANTAVSTDAENNWILLGSRESEFRYTLTVHNDTDKAMTKLVLIDNLPEEDDHSPFDSTAGRNSEFNVNFAAEPNVTVIVTPENGGPTALGSQYYTVKYSGDTSFTSSDWAGTPDAARWKDSLAGARSIRIVITDEGGAQIPAKAKVEVSFSAVAGNNAESGKIAWNSFGYHYGLAGTAAELEAMPLVVGVKIPSVPTLTKQLVDDLNQPIAAETDVSFRFLIYEGEALSGYDTEDALKAALAETNRRYMETTLTVNAGSSESETVKLLTEAFPWTDGQQYTAVELTDETETYRLSGFVGSDKTVTFTYDANRDTALVCRNVFLQWELRLTKVDSADAQKKLPGAVFALYSPNADDVIAAPDEYAGLDIQTELTVGDAVWYLFAVRTTGEDGGADWDKLTRERYYLLELKAPDSYNLPKEPGLLLTRDGALQGVYALTVPNTPGYALPETGGAGTTLFTMGGTLLLAGSLLSGYVLRRKRERRFMR